MQGNTPLIRCARVSVLRSGAELFGSSECACNQMGRWKQTTFLLGCQPTSELVGQGV